MPSEYGRNIHPCSVIVAQKTHGNIIRHCRINDTNTAWQMAGISSTIQAAPKPTSAHNDNASSISARDDGRLDAIASPFGLVLAARGSPERRDREASLRTASTREHPADQLQPQTPAKMANGSAFLSVRQAIVVNVKAVDR
jgi:hypothetical protein